MMEILTLLVALLGVSIALYSVTSQRKELERQIKELGKSALANEKAQEALHKQAKIQTLATLLNAETYLHEFNNKGGVHNSQKKFAQDNFNNIQSYKDEIKELSN